MEWLIFLNGVIFVFFILKTIFVISNCLWLNLNWISTLWLIFISWFWLIYRFHYCFLFFNELLIKFLFFRLAMLRRWRFMEKSLLIRIRFKRKSWSIFFFFFIRIKSLFLLLFFAGNKLTFNFYLIFLYLRVFIHV